MTFHNRAEVISLLNGLEMLELHERERDGEAHSGPKHWHTYDILARDPAERQHRPAARLALSAGPRTLTDLVRRLLPAGGPISTPRPADTS
jgi:hypothetical protein